MVVKSFPWRDFHQKMSSKFLHRQKYLVKNFLLWQNHFLENSLYEKNWENFLVENFFCRNFLLQNHLLGNSLDEKIFFCRKFFYRIFFCCKTVSMKKIFYIFLRIFLDKNFLVEYFFVAKQKQKQLRWKKKKLREFFWVKNYFIEKFFDGIFLLQYHFLGNSRD